MPPALGAICAAICDGAQAPRRRYESTKRHNGPSRDAPKGRIAPPVQAYQQEKNTVGRLGPILARSMEDETTEAAAMKVENMMNREVKTCHPQDHLNQGAQVMWENTCGAVPIVDQQRRPVGFLTDRDICMAAYTQGKPLQDLSVEGAMSHRVVACHADDDLSAAMRTMAETGLRRLSVIGNDGTLIGILSLDDIACEAGRTMRGGVNLELRNQVADITIAVCRGRVKARAPIKPD